MEEHRLLLNILLYSLEIHAKSTIILSQILRLRVKLIDLISIFATLTPQYYIKRHVER